MAGVLLLIGIVGLPFLAWFALAKFYPGITRRGGYPERGGWFAAGDASGGFDHKGGVGHPDPS